MLDGGHASLFQTFSWYSVSTSRPWQDTKHENNIAGSRFSVTTVRVGSAASVDGPQVYLAKGERLKQTTMNFFGRGEHDHHPAPGGTFIEMTINAYMMDQAWKI